MSASLSPSNDMIDTHDLSERRRAAFAQAQNHSRNVIIMRRVFPVLALICVCVYFLKGDFSVQYKNAKVSVKDIQLTKNELKMINPRMEGHDEKSGSYLIVADTASQKTGSPTIVHLQKIDAKLVHPTNGTMTLTAERGKFDTKTEVLDLYKNIRISGTNGLVAHLESANIIIKQQYITSNELIFIKMNGNTIKASKLNINGLTKVMTFTDRVKVRLIKTPKKNDIVQTN